MNNFGRYSPLQEAHRRARQQAQARQEARGAAAEITDRKAERRDRDQAVPQRTEQAGRAATRPAQPDRPIEARPRTLVPDAPAPGESEGHFVWRRLVTNRIEREQGEAATRAGDEISRIMRTETNPISRRTELKAAFDRQEADRAQRSAKGDKGKTSPEQDIEPEP